MDGAALRELVRKSVHIPGGLLPSVFLLLLGFRGAVALAVFLGTYLVVGAALALQRGVRVPLVASGMATTGRPTEGFPMGAAQFLLSVLLVGLLAPIPVFVSAVALLGAGDGTAGLVGRWRGHHPLPWNGQKTWEGLLAGIVVGTPVAAGFVVLGASVEERLGAWSFWQDPLGSLFWLLVVGTPLAFGLGRLVARLVPGALRANARPVETAMVLAAAVLPALFVARSPPGLFAEPLLAWSAGAGSAAGLVFVLAPLALLLESALHRNDNLVVPIAFAAGLLLLGGASIP